MSYSHESVAKALQDLRAMADYPEDAGNLGALLDFLEWVADLGRERVVLSNAERERFTAESAPLLAKGLRHIFEFINDCERILLRDWYDDEWIQVCERRSRIEFLRTLYQGAMPAGEFEYWLDTENLDDLIQQAGRSEGGLEPGEIPEGTPSSHWWWWHPARPSEGSRTRGNDMPR